MHDSEAVPCAIYRGGTSKGVFFREADLPYSKAARADILLSIFGSPDARQIDGLGGATSATSKAMIVGPSSVPGADVQMLFGQVSVSQALVDWGGICGNLTSAVAPFAIDHGLVAATEPMTDVVIYSLNSRKFIRARVPVRDGRAATEGDFSIPGVPGTGARIDVEYLDPAGSWNGRLLPTGRPCERMAIADGRSFTVSIVDAANPVVFCDARELGLRGTELPQELEARRELMSTLEAIRSAAAESLGIVSSRDEATGTSPGLPKIGFVSAPAAHDTLAGRVPADEVDIVGRLLSMQTAHRAYMGAGAICTGAAAMVKGTIVHQLCATRARQTGTVRIGHPSGVLDVAVRATERDGETIIASATIARTARRIMEGYAYVRGARLHSWRAPSGG